MFFAVANVGLYIFYKGSWSKTTRRRGKMPVTNTMMQYGHVSSPWQHLDAFTYDHLGSCLLRPETRSSLQSVSSQAVPSTFEEITWLSLSSPAPPASNP